MKTILLSFVIFLTATLSIEAQSIAKNALGVRIGDNSGFGGEISYQRHLKSNKRLEFDLGWKNNTSFDAYKLVGIHQWVLNLDKGFNWYAGVGGGLGSYQSENSDGIFFLVAGDIGIEYNFDIPLLLSFDFRPELAFNDSFTDDIAFDLGLGIRYQF